MTGRMVPAYCAFALALVAATYPVWRFWVAGFAPTMEELLQVRCGLF